MLKMLYMKKDHTAKSHNRLHYALRRSLIKKIKWALELRVGVWHFYKKKKEVG